MKKNSSNLDIDRILDEHLPTESANLKDIWNRVASAEDAPQFSPQSVESAWAAIRSETAHSSNPLPSPARTTRMFSHRPVWLSLAATLFFGAIGLYFWLQPITKYAAAGERLAATLPDGSTVELNSGSRIQYARDFETEREVLLEGEAFFDVRESNIPFIVTTFNGSVEVLGTRFNVNSWADGFNPSTIVALESGRVRVTPMAAPEQAFEMTPGQLRQIDGRNTIFAEDDTMLVRSATAWRNGDIILNQVALGIALEEIERRFDIEIETASNTLLGKKINLSLRSPSQPEEVIEKLSSALGVHYRPILGGFEMY